MENIVSTNDREWSRSEWYAVLQTACFRLNNLVAESDTIDSVMRLMFKCEKSDSLDMFELSSDYYLTNFCALLNGMLAFRDSKGRTFRISAVYKGEQRTQQPDFCKTTISHFIVTVKPSSDGDFVFPLLGE